MSKFVTLSALLIGALTSINVNAHEVKHQRDFNDVKTSKLKNIDSLRTCIAASNDFESLKSCRKNQRMGKHNYRYKNDKAM